MQLGKVFITTLFLLSYTLMSFTTSPPREFKKLELGSKEAKTQQPDLVKQDQIALKEARKGIQEARKRINSYSRNVYEVADARVFLGHTGYDEYFDLHKKRKGIEANAKRYHVISKMFKRKSSAVSEIFHGRAKELEKVKGQIHDQMDFIRANNQYDELLSKDRHQAHLNKYKEYWHALDGYNEIIRKHSH